MLFLGIKEKKMKNRIKTTITIVIKQSLKALLNVRG